MLNYNWLKLCTIFEAVQNQAYCLNFTKYTSIQIHQVFHVFSLETFQLNTLQNHIKLASPVVEVDRDKKCEVKQILNSKYQRYKLKYVISWTGVTPKNKF